MGTSRAAKAASHDRILDIAAARIRRDGIDGLSVAELMKEAGLTHGGFYRHFDSREHLVAEAAQRALSQGSAWTDRGRASSAGRGDTPRSSTVTSAPGTGTIPSPAAAWPASPPMPPAPAARPEASYTRQVKECLAVLADLIDNPDRQAGEREAVLTLSVLVGAISMARAVDDPDLSRHIMTNAAAALKQCILN